MQSLIQFKKATLPFRIPLLFACFAISPMAQAVSPPPDGGYPGGNTAEGFNALFNLSTEDGAFNTAIGFYSLFSNTTGSLNTAVGAGALDLNTGDNNTATGAAALLLNTTGTGNTATGAAALLSNSTGNNNTALGAGALVFYDGDPSIENSGSGNTAVGAAALASNVTGPGNTAVGAGALFNNTGDHNNPPGGRLNTAVGLEALYSNTIGKGNTAVGAGVHPEAPEGGRAPLASNTTGSVNTAVGGTDGGDAAALGFNTTGSSNTAVGAGALNQNTTGSSNTALGDTAGRNVVTANHVVCIGADVGGADVNNTTWISGIFDVTTQSGMTAPVIVSDGGQLGTVSSSERFKKDIATMDKASEAILSLRPVTFHYKTDTKGIPQFGLIAEEVAKANPALVLPDKEGKPYSVRYDQVSAMLLNEFLKARRQIDMQQKQIDALTAGLQKVSAQLESNKPALQTVMNNR
jgi:hypothetical protein